MIERLDLAYGIWNGVPGIIFNHVIPEIHDAVINPQPVFGNIIFLLAYRLIEKLAQAQVMIVPVVIKNRIVWPDWIYTVPGLDVKTLN